MLKKIKKYSYKDKKLSVPPYFIGFIWSLIVIFRLYELDLQNMYIKPQENNKEYFLLTNRLIY